MTLQPTLSHQNRLALTNRRHQTHYWFNSESHESLWEESLELPEHYRARQEILGYASTSPGAANSSGDYKDRIYREKIEIEMANLAAEDGSNDKDADKIQLLPKTTTPKSSSLEDNIKSSTNFDMCCYALFLRFHAVIIEAPLCAAEAVVRSSFFFLLFVFFTTVYLCRRRSIAMTALLMLNESIASFAAAVSFLVPGMVLFVYRAYEADGSPWQLSPLPTVVGWVDCQRFCVVSFGGGATATHSSSSSSEENSATLGMRDVCGVWTHPDHLISTDTHLTASLLRRHLCTQSVVLCVPRRLLSAASDVIAGAEVEERASLDNLLL